MKIVCADRNRVPLALLGSLVCSSHDCYVYDDPDTAPSDEGLYTILNRTYNRQPEVSDKLFLKYVISTLTTSDPAGGLSDVNQPNTQQSPSAFDEARKDLEAIQPRKEVSEPDVVLPTTPFKGGRCLQLGLAIVNALFRKSTIRNAWRDILRAALRIHP